MSCERGYSLDHHTLLTAAVSARLLFAVRVPDAWQGGGKSRIIPGLRCPDGASVPHVIRRVPDTPHRDSHAGTLAGTGSHIEREQTFLRGTVSDRS
jgi:hypothetical protein